MAFQKKEKAGQLNFPSFCQVFLNKYGFLDDIAKAGHLDNLYNNNFIQSKRTFINQYSLIKRDINLLIDKH